MSRADELKAKAARIKDRQAETSKDTVTAEDRERHLAPVAAPKATPIRSTVDLSPVRHQQLKSWCGETAVMIGKTRVTTQDVLRAFVARLVTDETLAEKIREDLRAGKE